MSVVVGKILADRFEIIRPIGAGGMGLVFEAFDREHHAHVALKTVQPARADAMALLRFKREFRALQDLHHSNLISLGELFADGDLWFFTMELLSASSFDTWVRPVEGETRDRLPDGLEATTPGRHLAEDRLRDAFAQLGEGLAVLHDAAIVHRDIKPSNVLVTDRGRVVLLDFGIVKEAERATGEQLIVGTAEYMAPEQAAAQSVGPPADCYAAGVMLFEALTGQLPFHGSQLEILTRKQHDEAPRASRLVAKLPADLEGLCAALLQRDPARRPTARDLLERLRGRNPPVQPVKGPALSFVGREPELAHLASTSRQARAGRPACLVVHGESGLGKSALVRRYLSSLDDDTVVLSGRCFERESVPYKAVDGIIDSLTGYMRGLPAAEAAALLPRSAGLLARVFPVLLGVPVFATAPAMAQAIIDPQELRSRLFAAFREILGRLCDRARLVIVIDDLQWADADSLAMIGEALRSPDAPGLLLLATSREPPRPFFDSVPIEALELRGLSPDESRELAANLLEKTDGVSGVAAAIIAEEAKGHPLFIAELVNHAASAVHRDEASPLSVDEIIWRRTRALDLRSQETLELIAVAGLPLPRPALAAATGASTAESLAVEAGLRAGQLVRTSGPGRNDTVDVFHDRIREALVARLSVEQLRQRHERLARALSAQSDVDDEILLLHWHRAGDSTKAATHALRAAERALGALAFSRAARLYRFAADAMPATDPARDSVLVKLADALAKAGHGAEAAVVFLEVAERLPDAGLELRRRAGEQLLITGHVEHGTAVLFGVLKDLGIRPAASARGALSSLLLRQAQLAVFGTRFRERKKAAQPGDLQRLDVFWSLAMGFATIDTIRGAAFQAQHLLLALKVGERARISRSLAAQAGFTAATTGSRKRTDQLIQQSEALAKEVGTPEALAWISLARGASEVCLGSFASGVVHLDQAETALRESSTAVHWELDTALLFAAIGRQWCGTFAETAGRRGLLLHEAHERGDVYADAILRTGLWTLHWVLDDRVELALESMRASVNNWPSKNIAFRNIWVFQLEINADLYLGRGRPSWDRTTSGWSYLEDTLFLYPAITGVGNIELHARAAIAAAVDSPRGQQDQLLAIVGRDIRRMERYKTRWGDALTALLRAEVMLLKEGGQRSVPLFQNALARCEAAGLMSHVAVIAYCLGLLIPGEAGAGHRAAADAWFRAQPIAKPARFARMIVPAAALLS
jgi:eukaryotic-like serine/threonine-protein kinase